MALIKIIQEHYVWLAHIFIKGNAIYIGTSVMTEYLQHIERLTLIINLSGSSKFESS